MLPESETLPANGLGYQMISRHLHHRQEHNNLHHDRMPHLDSGTFPALLYPISKRTNQQCINISHKMVGKGTQLGSHK